MGNDHFLNHYGYPVRSGYYQELGIYLRSLLIPEGEDKWGDSLCLAFIPGGE